MIPRRALCLRHGCHASIIDSFVLASLVKPTSFPIRIQRRDLNVLGNLTPRTSPPDHLTPQTSPSDHLTKDTLLSDQLTPSLATTLPTDSLSLSSPIIDTIMDAQRDLDLLTLQHIFGLKDASHASPNIKPKDLERLELLKAAQPVFVCVDLEAFEFAQQKITEVGVSILDSRRLINKHPSTWLSHIDSRHMIISEHRHLVNKRFLHGCPDKFNFGKSKFVSLMQIQPTLTQLFKHPSPDFMLPSDNGTRQLILVGHGLSNDKVYLNKINFDPHSTANILCDMDTTALVGSKKNTVGLSKMMTGLGVEPENLHNAGNDAAYTLQALVLIVVQHTEDPGAYLQAVSDAKGKLDPAKERYKAHRKVLREKKAAEAKVMEEEEAKFQASQMDMAQPGQESTFQAAGASKEKAVEKERAQPFKDSTSQAAEASKETAVKEEKDVKRQKTVTKKKAQEPTPQAAKETKPQPVKALSVTESIFEPGLGQPKFPSPASRGEDELGSKSEFLPSKKNPRAEKEYHLEKKSPSPSPPSDSRTRKTQPTKRKIEPRPLGRTEAKSLK
jgi:hypothetical protein